MTAAGAPGRPLATQPSRARSARFTVARSPRPWPASEAHARSPRPQPAAQPASHSAAHPTAQSASCPYQARSSCFIDRWNAITSASTTSGCISADSDFFARTRSGPLPVS